MAEWKAYFLLDDALTGSLGSLEAACQTLPGANTPVSLRTSDCLSPPTALQGACLGRALLHVVRVRRHWTAFVSTCDDPIVPPFEKACSISCPQEGIVFAAAAGPGSSFKLVQTLASMGRHREALTLLRGRRASTAALAEPDQGLHEAHVGLSIRLSCNLLTEAFIEVGQWPLY